VTGEKKKNRGRGGKGAGAGAGGNFGRETLVGRPWGPGGRRQQARTRLVGPLRDEILGRKGVALLLYWGGYKWGGEWEARGPSVVAGWKKLKKKKEAFQEWGSGRHSEWDTKGKGKAQNPNKRAHPSVKQTKKKEKKKRYHSKAMSVLPRVERGTG